MNVNHWYRPGYTGYIQEQTGVDNFTKPVWGKLIPIKYKSQEQIIIKNMWQRKEKDRLTKLSVNVDLDPDKKYRVFLNTPTFESDTSDEDQAILMDNIRPVRDHRERFVHTVVWL